MIRVYHGTAVESARSIGGQLDAGQYVTALKPVAEKYARRTARVENRLAGLDPNDATQGAVLTMEVKETDLVPDDDRLDPEGITRSFKLLTPAQVLRVDYVDLKSTTPSRDQRGLFTIGRYRT